MASDLQVGDIVQLKSGGPKMTVSDLKSLPGLVRCTWFAGAKNEHGTFPPEALVPAPAEKPKG